ncbi:MAG: ferrous iron transport protein B [bacterium]
METKTIVLAGQPGSGKSTLFDIMSDINTPSTGATFDYRTTEIDLHGETVRIVDLPGIYSLNPNDPAEKLAVEYLLNNKIDLIINVVNTTMLSRSLELSVELLEFGIPMVIAMNMQDEAEQHGLKINTDELNKQLNIPVQFTSARYGKGVRKLADKCYMMLMSTGYQPKILNYTHHLEVHISEIQDIILSLATEQLPTLNSQLSTSKGINGSNRFLAIKSIENPEILNENLRNVTKELTDKIEHELHNHHKMDSYETISYERHHLAMKISESITKIVKRTEMPMSEKLDSLLLHPVWGYLALLLFFGSYFFSIFLVGNFLSALVDAPIVQLAETFAPLLTTQPFLWYTINGAYMGLAGVVGIVLPYFLPLVFLTSLFEDTGYITRIAFLLDGLMHKIGLHGKSVAPFILGFGCSVPALYATRMIENKRDRMITGVLIPFVPCTARIAVIFALTAAFAGPVWAIVVFFFVLIVISISSKIMSKLLTKPTGLIMDIPNLKLPSISISLKRTWYKIKDFIKDAILFLIGGSIVLGWIEYFQVANYINKIFAPILTYILGLPEQLGSTLVFGFLRKELIIVMANQAMGVPSLTQLPMSLDQIMIFIIFVTLYFPCLATLVVLWKEFGRKTAIAAAVFSVIVATVSAFLFKIGFMIF